MKKFILLSLLSIGAQAACDYGTPELSQEIRCDKNFSCLEAVIRDSNESVDEIDTLIDYSTENKCNHELKMTELFAKIIWEENEKPNELHIDNSERGNTKFDLPVIPDAPVDSASKTQRQ